MLPSENYITLSNNNIYDVKMQQDKCVKKLNIELGKVIQDLRIAHNSISISELARSYDLDRGNLSKMENGKAGCTFVTLWKLSEALGIKCSDLVRMLEERLGDNFTLIDE